MLYLVIEINVGGLKMIKYLRVGFKYIQLHENINIILFSAFDNLWNINVFLKE